MPAAEPGAGRRIAAVWVTGLILGTCGGCISGSLAGSTGRRVQGPWSVETVQHAHVGEDVAFDFILTRPFTKHPLDPRGIADYCALKIGDTLLLAEPDWQGHFGFVHNLDRVADGDVLRATATAYRTHGHRDPIVATGQGRWNPGPNDEPDWPVARDAITLRIYQARIEFEMDEPPDPVDADSGRLLIRKSDGTTHSIYADRPGRPGYTLEPAEGGRLRITYFPRAEELNPTGQTQVEFTLYDQTGRRHSVETAVDTP